MWNIHYAEKYHLLHHKISVWKSKTLIKRYFHSERKWHALYVNQFYLLLKNNELNHYQLSIARAIMEQKYTK